MASEDREYARSGNRWRQRKGDIDNITSFYGSSCATNGKDALNTLDRGYRYNPHPVHTPSTPHSIRPQS
eukprot:6724268-Pyramimonas_sp.AAC.1